MNAQMALTRFIRGVTRLNYFPARATIAIRHSITCLGLIAAASVSAATLPPGTAIPIVFPRTVHADKAKPGDTITAKTMQAVLLPEGRLIPKGTRLMGHITEVSSFHFDDTPYAVQKPSVLAVTFDRLVEQGEDVPVHLSMRALANTSAARAATTPQGMDESDDVGFLVLVGGAHYSPRSGELLAPGDDGDDDIVGYARRQGVFARLLPGSYESRVSHFHCDGTSAEQSVGIFSPDACGIYGFGSMQLSASATDYTFRIESRRHDVTLYSGSAALLQVTAQP